MSLTVTQGKVKEKEYKILGNGRLSQGLAFLVYQPLKGNKGNGGSGCNVRTQDPENFDEEVKSLVTAWRWNNSWLCLTSVSFSFGVVVFLG